MTILYISDLDGTLLHSDLSVSAYTTRQIHRLIECGRHFSYATARSAFKARELTSGLNISAPAIVLNGAEIHGVDGEIFCCHALEAALVLDLIEIGKRYRVSPFVLGRDEAGREVLHWVSPENEAQANFLKARKNDPRLLNVHVPVPACKSLSVSFLAPKQNAAVIAQEARALKYTSAHVMVMDDIYSSGYCSIEIQHKLASKDQAIRLVCDYLGMSPADVTVFGDQINDLPMFEVAGRSVAVKNAHPEVLAQANHMTDCNDEDGVAKFIARDLS